MSKPNEYLLADKPCKPFNDMVSNHLCTITTATNYGTDKGNSQVPANANQRARNAPTRRIDFAGERKEQEKAREN